MVQYEAILTMAYQYEVEYDLLNGVTFNAIVSMFCI